MRRDQLLDDFEWRHIRSCTVQRKLTVAPAGSGRGCRFQQLQRDVWIMSEHEHIVQRKVVHMILDQDHLRARLHQEVHHRCRRTITQRNGQRCLVVVRQCVAAIRMCCDDALYEV
jgi:hypothetical protein